MDLPVNLDQKAFLYARDAHASIDQRRKYTGQPYILHPARVVEILRYAGVKQPEIIQAAYLHDVIEDVAPKNPEYNINQIKEVFGMRVANIVIELTDIYGSEHFPQHNRAARKAMEAARLSKISLDAMKIKLADLIDNTSDIVSNDKGFAKVYLAEKKVILDAFKPRVELANDLALEHLYKQACSQITHDR